MAIAKVSKSISDPPAWDEVTLCVTVLSYDEDRGLPIARMLSTFGKRGQYRRGLSVFASLLSLGNSWIGLVDGIERRRLRG